MMSIKHPHQQQIRSNHMTWLPSAALTGLLLASGAALAETADADSMMARLQQDAPRNWGKWGDGDQIGALNYLDEAQARRAAAAVRSGRRFMLQVPMTHGDGPVFPGRIPTQHFMASDESAYSSLKIEPMPGGMKASDDVVFMFLQGTTHVDALAHAWYGDQVYGGVSADSTIHGHTHADIGALADHGIVGRGVLLDVGRHLGSEGSEGEGGRLPPDTCVHLADIQATAEAQNVTLEKRDILILRTGSIARFYEEAPDHAWNAMNEPGLCYSMELLDWLHEMEIPAITADNIAVERVAQDIEGETFIIPLHGALMRDLGIILTEIAWLEDLAADSAADGQYTFMYIAAPLKMEGGTGSPVNPVAIK